MNMNSLKKLFSINYPTINYKDSSFLNFDQKICSFINQEQIDLCPSYVDENNNQDIIDSIRLFNDFSKVSTKFDKSFIDTNVFKKENKVEDCHKINNLTDKKKVGRKRKVLNKENETEPTNYNIIRKCKNIVLEYTLKFINSQIKEVYEGDIGEGIYKKELLDINSEQKSDNRINSIKNFLNKTLKEIFSVNISERYTSYLSNRNEVIIKRLLNESDINKREKFNKLFNLTFSDCMKIFIDDKNSKDFKVIEGFPKFNEIKIKLNESEKYLNKINEFLMKFEDIVKNKKARKRNNINKKEIKEKTNNKFLITK